MLAVIAAVVSYSHMYELALRQSEPEWRAALFPLSVDGMIVASSMTLLSDARHGRKGGVLPWSLLIIGSRASFAANVAMADPTMWSWIIHAWPSFALIGAYELLMREFRTAAKSVRSADAARTHSAGETTGADVESDSTEHQARRHLQVVKAAEAIVPDPGRVVGEHSDQWPPKVQRDAWEWALENRRGGGSLPTGEELAEQFDRKPRWGRFDWLPSVASTVSR
ncbi:hypothetical protein HNR10_000731 [Nocardiopsis aegyptia]|uniref:DUF2637 domain-containing protein n=1 Tax=Nocardiopsis aegyptia TaxID=220378 RepID=A0A7Z0J904_9ACTN|nr:hypothetical protein [Nocardiopsis aegyptia]